jgi:hypothetical protein
VSNQENIRRSQRVRKSAIPDDYEIYTSEEIHMEGDPTSYEEAMSVGNNRQLLPSTLAGIDRRSCRRLLLGSTASCKVSSAKGYWTRRFGAVERRTFSVFLIAI